VAAQPSVALQDENLKDPVPTDAGRSTQSPTVNGTEIAADPAHVELLLQPLSTPLAATLSNALVLMLVPEEVPALLPALLSLLLLLLLLLQEASMNPLADAAGQVAKVARHCAEQSVPLQELTGA